MGRSRRGDPVRGEDPTVTAWRARHAGLSLVELMVALVIGTILMLGVVQVFGASRASYQLSEGMSRAQENARFAMDFLQRDIRMAGHFGCVNDQAHAQNTPSGLRTTFAAPLDPRLDFRVSIQGFEATNSGPGATVQIVESPVAGGGGFTPALPAELAAATSNRIQGSDIIALRYLAPEGVPVTAIAGSVAEPRFGFDPARWDVLRSGTEMPGLYGVADCLHSVVFQASALDTSVGSIVAGTSALNVNGFTNGFTDGQSYLHRAESIVYYVGTNGRGGASLYRARFTATPGGNLGFDRQEMVEGVENLQLLFGQDRELDPARPPTGYIDRHRIAGDIHTDAAAPGAAGWRRVGAVQVGLLTASPERAAAPVAIEGNELRAAGVTYTVPGDGRYRATYQTTVALRNRLYGN